MYGSESERPWVSSGPRWFRVVSDKKLSTNGSWSRSSRVITRGRQSRSEKRCPAGCEQSSAVFCHVEPPTRPVCCGVQPSVKGQEIWGWHSLIYTHINSIHHTNQNHRPRCNQRDISRTLNQMAATSENISSLLSRGTVGGTVGGTSLSTVLYIRYLQ